MSILDTLAAGEQNPGLQYGVSAGIVTNNKDPDGLARVKLKFPWLSDDNETDWVRIAFLAAGARRGSFFLPEVGDEVLVAFEHGDINSPYVIGTLWNAKDRPPETNGDGKNNIRKITSRSGHEIVFDDNAEGKKEKLEIKTNAGHKIVLDDAPGQEKIEIVDKSGSNKILIDTVQKAVNIESEMQLKIKANMVEIAGSTKLVLTSDGIVEIKGSMVKIN
jgi:uncharacterized protein involved in type VI secretion and phage assembly